MDIYYEIINVISRISPISAFIGGLSGLFMYKKLNVTYKLITFYLLLGFLNDLLSRVLSSYLGSNLFFFSSYAIIDLVFIFLFLSSFLSSRKIIFNSMFLIILLFNIYELLTVNFLNFSSFQVYSRTLNSFFLLIMSGIMIVKKIKQDKLEDINTIHYVLICYLGIAILLNLPINLLINYTETQVYFVWLINTLNVILFYNILTYQLWKFGKTRKI